MSDEAGRMETVGGRMGCEMCDIGAGICGEVREGDGFRAEHYLSKNVTTYGWELWAANRDDEGGEVTSVTVVPVSYCPWCGRKLDDGKGAGE